MASLPSYSTKSPTIKRILSEARELASHPDPTLHAAPLETNLFEWHFTLRGPPSTPYASGAYHGRIILPPSYPLRPPSFRFLTPSGRFEVNREICLSISGHHEETWQPAWGIRTALWALRAFMEGDAKGQVGGMDMGKSERERLAGESRAWKCMGCGGRANEDILKEEGGEEGDAEVKRDLPEELRFGFKDEMQQPEEKKDKGKAKEVVETPAEDQGAEKVEAVRQTAPVTERDYAPVTSVPAAPRLNNAVPAVAQRTSSDGVPVWVDKAITGVIAALALLIIKKILV